MCGASRTTLSRPSSMVLSAGHTKLQASGIVSGQAQRVLMPGVPPRRTPQLGARMWEQLRRRDRTERGVGHIGRVGRLATSARATCMITGFGAMSEMAEMGRVPKVGRLNALAAVRVRALEWTTTGWMDKSGDDARGKVKRENGWRLESSSPSPATANSSKPGGRPLASP